MASGDDDFRLLMHRAAAGCEDAARELVTKYGDYVHRAVRRVLSAKLRCQSQFDSTDFAQLVWRSFFRARDGLKRFENPAELVAFLVGVARNKVALEGRHQGRSDKRGDHEHQSIDDPSPEVEQLADGGPTPMEEAIAREKLEHILAGQPPRFRRIIELRLRGRTLRQIARALRVTRGVVYRFLKWLARKHP